MNDGLEFVKEYCGVKEYRVTANGLRVLLFPRLLGQAVAFLVHYGVGSRNEVSGSTGAAHFLEHLMFKGSEHFPASVMGIDRMFAKVGAYINANTSWDRTQYFEIVSSEHLELCMRVEADRMRNAAFSRKDLDDEMTVVRNELEMGDSKPEERLFDLVVSSAIHHHPYHHPVIGWREDVENMTFERLREFYDTFYHPNNAMVIVAGNFVEEDVLSGILRHFGGIPPSQNLIPCVHAVEQAQLGERRVLLKCAGRENGIVGFAWRIPNALHEDSAALAMLSEILARGDNSLLRKRFVLPGHVRKISVSWYPFCDQFLLFLFADLMKGRGHARWEKEILSFLSDFRADSISEEYFESVKLRLEADALYQKDDVGKIASCLGDCEGAGAWELYFDIDAKVQAISREDIARVCRAHIRPDNMTVGWFVPEKNSGAEVGR